MKETYARRRRRDIHMRRHAHEGDMRTKETYTRKDIHTEGHSHKKTYTRSDIYIEDIRSTNEGTCT